MKLFEFDIAWDQAINTSFDQDDIKTTGYVRVETDGIRIIAPDAETAERALRLSFAYRNLEVRGVARELLVHIWADFQSKAVASVGVTRRVGPEVLNELGKRAKALGW